MKIYTIEESIAESFKELYKNIDNDEDADYKIVSKEEDEFKVHSFILKARSKVLKNMVTNNFKEKNSKTIDFKEFASKAVKCFIQFL